MTADLWPFQRRAILVGQVISLVPLYRISLETMLARKTCKLRSLSHKKATKFGMIIDLHLVLQWLACLAIREIWKIPHREEP